jgi:hypothetical protein
MIFDITEINKVKLLMALYENAKQTDGAAHAEVLINKDCHLSETDCINALNEFNDSSEIRCYRIFDYFKGKAMKTVFERKRNGRIVIDSDNYDQRNGRYQFLKTMIDTFPIGDVRIINKTFKPYTIVEMDQYGKTTKEEILYYRHLLKNTTKKQNDLGSYWQINQL